MSLLRVSFWIVLGCCTACSKGMDPPPPTTGFLYVVGAENVTTLPYPDPNESNRTVMPLSEDYPSLCSDCNVQVAMEDCNFEQGYCFKLSDDSVSLTGTNGSLLYNSPYTLDSECTPWQFLRLDDEQYGILCKEFTYQVFKVDTRELDEIQHGSDSDSSVYDSILVTWNGRLYNVELVYDVNYGGTAIIAYDVYHGDSVQIQTDIDCIYLISIHSLYSSRFILSCMKDNGERVYFLHSLNAQSDHVFIDLCGEPFSFPGSDTFAVTCNKTLTVYLIDDISNQYSWSFETTIISRSYVDNSTLIVDEGGQQHFINTGTFLQSNGTDGITTLNSTANCSLTKKLVAPELYATMCENGAVYSVRLFDIRFNVELPPVHNLSIQPWNVYFQLAVQPSQSVYEEYTTHTTLNSSDVLSSPTSMPTFSESSYVLPSPESTPDSTVTVTSEPSRTPFLVSPSPTLVTDSPPNSESNTLTFVVSSIVIIVIIIILFILAAIVVVCAVKRLRRKHYSIEETPKPSETPLVYV